MSMRALTSAVGVVLCSLAALASACTDRTQPSSAVGRRLAEHLCPIQATCGCDEELLIPSCEARVEREFIASEREALAAGLEFDESCVAPALEDIDSLATCDRPSLGPSCPVYTARAEVGEPCEIFDHVPWMTHCNAGLSCIQGKCKDLDNPHLLYEGEVCSETQANLPTRGPRPVRRGLDVRQQRHEDLRAVALLAPRARGRRVHPPVHLRRRELLPTERPRRPRRAKRGEPRDLHATHRRGPAVQLRARV
jgi:hypothetical protein